MTRLPFQVSGSNDRWDALAQYNSEVWRGLLHTAEYQRRMAAEQTLFDQQYPTQVQEEEEEIDPEPLFRYERQVPLPFWGSVASVALLIVLVAAVAVAVLILTT